MFKVIYTKFYGTITIVIHQNIDNKDFPGGTVVKNPPANAGNTGSPWSGKIPHAMEQLSLCTTTTEPVL